MRPKLHTVLALAFAGAILLFGSVTLILLDRLASAALAQRTQAALLGQAQQLSAQLDAGLTERLRDLTQLSRLLGDRAAPRRPLLDSLKSAFPSYAWIGVTDPTGRVLAATGGLLEGQDVSARPWFQRGREGPWLGDVHEAKLLARLLPPAADGPRRFVDVTVPLRDPQGRLSGVLGAHLDWAWVQEARADLVRQLDPESGVTIRLISAAGQVLIGPPRPARPTGAVVASSGLPDGTLLGWQVEVSQPAALAYADLTRFRRAALTAQALLTALFAALGVVVAGRLTRPLQQLRGAATQVQTGARDVRIPQVGEYEEARRLAAALQHLLDTLRTHERGLEDRIAQRTRELEERTREAEALAALAALAAADGRVVQAAVDAAGILRAALELPAAALVSPAMPTQSRVFPASGAPWPAPPASWSAQGGSAPPGWPDAVTLLPLPTGPQERLLLLLPVRPGVGARLTLAAQQAVRVRAERTRALDILNRAAHQDALTGLHNRRALDDDLHALAQRPSTLVVMDLDGLKRLNDREGHAVGDALLRSFALALTRAFPQGRVYRMGGDEFAVLLDGTLSDEDLNGAVIRAVKGTRQSGFDMDASAGFARLPDDEAQGTHLIRLADQRMYAVKRARQAQRFLTPP
ncbi:sensor domain-containing diguanylate cyclase [Deinococcus sedimenti]|uniref:Diguanylate cyclase n=1 Tax=Deinococcus sedimenti TaxID=1867090 RepID=A0ABQ2S738_9DEIO|nr:sensor domain-containing diguanylate cyclase [Deinococcus sedimenti]GGR92541.1 hypothetical protein GCM10008960_19310 [Deinococcus sedimenti]